MLRDKALGPRKTPRKKAPSKTKNNTLATVSTPSYSSLHKRRRNSRKRHVDSIRPQVQACHRTQGHPFTASIGFAQSHIGNQAHITSLRNDQSETAFSWFYPYQTQHFTNAVHPFRTQTSNLEAVGNSSNGDAGVGRGPFTWPYPQAGLESVYPGWGSYSQSF